MAADIDIATYLVAQGVGTALGTDVFAGRMPSAVDGVVVTSYPGRAPELVINSNGYTHRFPRLQVLVRNSSEATAQSTADAAALALSKVKNTTLSGTRYRSVNVTQTPGLIERDENERYVYAFNVECEQGV